MVLEQCRILFLLKFKLIVSFQIISFYFQYPTEDCLDREYANLNTNITLFVNKCVVDYVENFELKNNYKQLVIGSYQMEIIFAVLLLIS